MTAVANNTAVAVREPPRPVRTRRWYRWALRLLLAVVVLRVLLGLFLPQVLALVAGFFGLSLDVRGTSLSLLGLSFRAEDMVVRIADRPDAPMLLTAQDLAIDLSMRSLLAGDLVVVDAALAGARITVLRGRDGRLVLPASWMEPGSDPEPPEPEPAEPFRFELPAVLTSVRLHDVQLHFLDATAEPPLHAALTIDFDATDVGDPGKPGTLLVRAHSPGYFDEAFLQARIVATGDRADVEWQAALHSLRPDALPIRLDLPPAVRRQPVHVDAEGKLNGETRADAPHMPALTASVDVHAALGAGEHATIALRAGPLARSDAGEDVLPFTVATAFPGLFEALRLDGGEVARRDGTTSVRGTLAFERLTLAVLATELRTRGITLPDGGLDATARFDVELGAGITGSLHDAVVTGGGESMRLLRASVNDLRGAGDGLAIAAITIDGPVAAVRRDADGTLVAAGVRIAPPAAADPPPPPPVVAPPPAAPFSLPKVRLGSFAWQGLACTFTDATMQPPATIGISDVEVLGDSVTIGAEAPPGRFSAAARIADAVESLRVDVALTPAATSLAAELQVNATGITGGALAPWLQRAGFKPVLRAGDLRLLAAASVTCEPAGTKVSARLADLRFRDGDEVLVGLRNVTGTDLRLGGDVADLGTWRIDEPFLAVHRDASGALHVAGLQQVAPPPASAGAAPPPRSRTRAGATAPTKAEVTSLPTLPRAHLTVDRAVLRWSVPDVPPCSIGIDAVVDAGGAASPVTLASTLRIDGALHEARFTGKLTPNDGWHFDADVTATGMRGAGFAALLPPNARCTLNDGAMQAHLTAHLRTGTAIGVELQLDGVQLTDNGEEIAAIDHLRVDAPDVGADRTHVKKVEASGMRALATETPGGLHLPGLFLATPPRAPAAPGAAPDNGPAEASSPPPAASTSLRLPVFAIDELSLVCERIVVRERLASDGEPLVIAGKLTMAPWAPDLERGEPAPAKLTLLASATPLCKELRADVTVNPYELQPSAEIVLAGTLDLTAIPRVSPRLAELVQGLSAAAEFSATINARFDLRRRDARTVVPGRPFGAELICSQIVFRDAASGTTYASVGMVDIDARAIDPASGDVMLRSIDVDEVAIGIKRTPEGAELLGMRVRLPESAPPPIAATVAAHQPAPTEFSVDRIDLRGVSVSVTDETTTPPTLLPFGDVEATLKNFSTRTFTEARPFAFSLTMHGGELSLPKRTVYASVLGGVLSSATRAVTFSGDRVEMEQRALVDEITVSGQMQFVPFLRGQLRTRVVDFELQSLCGIAKHSGVDIADGVVNHRSTINIQGPEGTHLTANTAFTYLSLSETAGGPISTYLRLPAPLDTVLFLLKNDADEHRLPIEATVPTEQLGSGALAQAAVDAITQLVADAVASAPTRAIGTVTDPFGNFLGIGGASTFVPVHAEVPFAPADPLPAAVVLQPIVDALGDENVEVVLTHELGKGDLPRAEQLATPPAAVRAAAVDRLCARRAELDAARCHLAGEVAALYASGRMQEAWVKQEQLVAQDNRLGELEQTLDEALNILAGDTPHAARRRTQAAAQALGNARIGVVRDRLLRLAPGLTDDRIIVRPARGSATELPDGGRVIAAARRRTVR